MKNFSGIISFALVVVLFGYSGCKCDDCEDTTDLTLQLNASFENNPFAMNNAFTDQLGNSLRYTTFKFYMSDIVLVKEDNSKVEISDIELVDLASGGTFEVDAEVVNGSYKAIEFGLGVSPDLNSKDPSMFPNDHPLSSFQNTFWSWASKYRFALIEGDVDTAGDLSFPIAFIYHTGLDTLYKTRTIPLVFLAAGGSETVDLSIETEEIFFRTGREIDYTTEKLTHTTDNLPLAAKVTENLFDAIK